MNPFGPAPAHAHTRRSLLTVLAVAVTLLVGAPSHAAESPTESRYQQGPASPDGIGRFYLGREIAFVMGHQGAPWLERPERQEEERPDLLHSLLRLEPGMAVADIGAGTGYHSWRMAQKVGARGKVYAVDIQPEMLTLLASNMTARGVSNVVGVLGTITDPKLPPNSLDLALLVDVYHEFDHPYEMLTALRDALKLEGRIAFVEFRGEQESVPIKRLHKMSEAQVRKEAEAIGLEWIETRRELPWQHLVLFRRGAAKSPAAAPTSTPTTPPTPR